MNKSTINWINPEIKPPVGVPILAYGVLDDGYTSNHEITTHEAIFDSSGKYSCGSSWDDLGNPIEVYLTNVTHWAAMPKPGAN